MKALLDTNILLDIFQKRDFDREGLEKLFAMQHFGDLEAWVSSKSHADTFHFLRKELGSERAQELMHEGMKRVKTCSVDEDDVKEALSRRWPDFEDCLIAVCAEKVKADFIVTRDAEGFAGSKIPHGTAGEFMEFVSEQTNITYAIE